MLSLGTLAANVELRTKSGRQPLRTLQQTLGTQPMDFQSFELCLRRFLPSVDREVLRALFEKHEEDGLVRPDLFARRVFGLEGPFDEGRIVVSPPLAAQRSQPDHLPEFHANRPAVFDRQANAPTSEPPCAAFPEQAQDIDEDTSCHPEGNANLGYVPSRCQRQAWEDAPAFASHDPRLLEAALQQMREALDRSVMLAGRRQGSVYGGLPPAERVTLHATQAKAAALQLALLRLLRVIDPKASSLSLEQLSRALAPLRSHVDALLQGKWGARA